VTILQQVLADQKTADNMILCLDGTIYVDDVAARKYTDRDTTDNDDADDEAPNYNAIG
jgi:hypothetical protein